MLLSLLVILPLAPSSGTDEPSSWPSWRGPDGSGVATSTTAPLEWSRQENVRWRVALDHPANGSPVVQGDRIFLTTPRDPEGRARSLECYSRTDGDLLWRRTVELGRVMPTHKTNPYCGSTPAASEEHVVVWHSSAGLHCYDHDGAPVWSRDLGEFRHVWGYGTSPIIHEGRVYLNTGPGERSFVTAIDLKTGETIWETVEPDFRTEEEIEEKRLVGSWCTPMVIQDGSLARLICGQPTRAVAYRLSDGAHAWTCDGVAGKRGDLTYSSPVMAGETCVFVGGWVGPTLGVKIHDAGPGSGPRKRWRHAGQMSNIASGVYMNGRVLIPDMSGILWCLDPATGVPDWKERVARGETWGSIVAVGERMYLLSQDGTTVVFKADQEGLEILAKNSMEEATNSTLAIADGEIFLRTHEHLYCIAE